MNALSLYVLGDREKQSSLARALNANLHSTSRSTLNQDLKKIQDSWILLLEESDQIKIEDIPRLKHLLENPLKPPYLFEIKAPGLTHKLLGLALFHSEAKVEFSEGFNQVRFSEGSLIRCEPHMVSIIIHRAVRTGETLVRDEVIVASHESRQQQDPQNWRSFYLKSISLTRLKRQKEAMQSLLQAHKINPQDVMTLNNLGYNSMDLQKFEESKYYFEKALAISPRFETVLSNMGVLYMRWHKLEKAVECFKKAIEVKKDTPQDHYNMGNALFRLGRIAEAIFAYEQAIAYDPDYEKALSELGMAYFQMNQNEQAKLRIDQSLDREVKFAQTIFNAAVYFLQNKNRLKAQSLFQEILVKFPGSDEAERAQTALKKL